VAAVATDRPSSRPRVLILTHNYPRFRGDISGVFLHLLLKNLDSDFEFIVLCPHQKDLPESEVIDGIRVDRFRYGRPDEEMLAYTGEMHIIAKKHPLLMLRFNKRFEQAAVKLIEDDNIDLLWAHWWIPAGYVAERAARRTGQPYYVTCHGTDVFLLGKMAMLKMIGKPVFAKAAGVSVVSNYLKDSLIESLGDGRGLSRRTEIIPMPVDQTLFNTDGRTERDIPAIISPSRFTSQKRLDLLVEACSMLARDGVPFRLNMYGDGPERARIEGLASASPACDSISLYPALPQAELAQAYRASDIAVLVSEREGFGLVLVEAMLCGCAAVGVRSGGIPDILGGERTGQFLIETATASELYEKLKRLLTDRPYLQEAKSACREEAEARFSSDTVRRRFTEFLTSRQPE